VTPCKNNAPISEDFSVIPAPALPGGNKLQPESSVFNKFWTPAPVPDPDPGFAGVTVFGNIDDFCNDALVLRFQRRPPPGETPRGVDQDISGRPGRKE